MKTPGPWLGLPPGTEILFATMTVTMTMLELTSQEPPGSMEPLLQACHLSQVPSPLAAEECLGFLDRMPALTPESWFLPQGAARSLEPVGQDGFWGQGEAPDPACAGLC